jgi:uncharacterized repeat protein (TIGR01451 family)
MVILLTEAAVRVSLNRTLESMITFGRLILGVGYCVCIVSVLCPSARASTVPAEVSQQIANGDVVEVIIEYDATTVERDLSKLRARLPRRISDDALLNVTRSRYQQLKTTIERSLSMKDMDLVSEYSHLPMKTLKVKSANALAALAAHPNIKAIYPNSIMQRAQALSGPDLAQIDQPAVAAVGYGGSGTTVVVIDDGIVVTNPAFGCTAVGTPVGCRVVANQTLVATPGTNFSHGTNVSAIVTGVASAANVAMLNVFSANGALNSDIIAGINWAISNRKTYNIVAINMSLGDGSHNNSTCSKGNSYVTPVSNAQAAGISVVVAAGNSAYVNNAFTPGLSIPACTPGVISVGSVYDSNLGGLIWGAAPNQCTDNTSQVDQITCFSQSAPILTLLAPGALITAGGVTEGGTSQATPHVAGAIATLRAAFPNDTLAKTLARITTSNVHISDPRNAVVTPRLMMDVAAQPSNDTFALRQIVSGSSGSSTGVNLLASLTTDNPLPVSAGTSPVWWTWTAPASGQVTLSTTGSNFPTQLAAFTGNSLATLNPIVSGANVSASVPTSQVIFEAQSGVAYQWAVGSAGAATGQINLQWNLNTAAAANLSSSIGGPNSASAGATATYLLSVKNSGPQTATNVSLTLNIPAGASIASIPTGCISGGSSITCSVATLANGTTASWPVQLTVNNPGAGLTLATSVTSDVPDPSAATSASTFFVQPSVQIADNGDVPLPTWAVMLLAIGLTGTLFKASRARNQVITR